MTDAPKTAKSPDTHNRPRFYYGWVIVAVMGLVTAVSLALGGVNFGFFIKPMSDDLGISQAFFGWAQTARLVGFALTSFLVGKALDRFGARLPLAIAAALMGGAVFALALITEGWHLVALFLLIGTIGMQGGGGNLYSAVPLATWFRRNRGKAMAVMALGGPIGVATMTPLTQFFIDEFGWKATWQILGVGGGTLLFVVALLFVRRRPEDMGLLPDGDNPDEAGSEVNVAHEGPARPSTYRTALERSWTRSEAVRTPTLWMLTVGFGAFMFSTTNLILFRIPFFVDEGFSAQLVAFSFAVQAAAAALVAIPSGAALDRFPPRYLALAGCTVMGLSFAATMTVEATWQVFAAGVFFGAGINSMGILQNTVWPTYFGHAHLGAIRGFSMPFTVAFTAIGPPLTGIIKDATGSYFPAWWASVGVLLIGALLLFFTRPPRVPSQAPRG